MEKPNKVFAKGRLAAPWSGFLIRAQIYILTGLQIMEGLKIAKIRKFFFIVSSLGKIN